MEAQNTGNTSAADAAADRAANIDTAIFTRLAQAGALAAPRPVSEPAPVSPRPQWAAETGARLKAEDAARKAAGQPVHQTGTRPITQPNADLSKQQSQEQQDGEQSQEQVQPPHGEGHQLEVPIRNSREDWSGEVTAFGSVAHAGGMSAEVSQHIVDFVNDETPKNSPMLGGDGNWNTDRVISDLHQEWGAQFSENLALAHKAATSDPRLAAYLDRTGAGNSPTVLRLLAEYGKDPHLFNPATAQAKADKILNDMSHPYWNGSKSARFLVSFLFKIAQQR